MQFKPISRGLKSIVELSDPLEIYPSLLSSSVEFKVKPKIFTSLFSSVLSHSIEGAVVHLILSGKQKSLITLRRSHKSASYWLFTAVVSLVGFTKNDF